MWLSRYRPANLHQHKGRAKVKQLPPAFQVSLTGHQRPHRRYLSKLPSELRLPLFFFSVGGGVPWSDPCGEGVGLSLLRPDILRVFPSFPKDLRGDLNFKEPLPEAPAPVFSSLASFSSSSSSNGLRSLGPPSSRREEPGDQWCCRPWSRSLSKGMLMFRLILRRIKALSRVGPPPFRRWFLVAGMRRRGRGGQRGKNLWKNKKINNKNNKPGSRE